MEMQRETQMLLKFLALKSDHDQRSSTNVFYKNNKKGKSDSRHQNPQNIIGVEEEYNVHAYQPRRYPRARCCTVGCGIRV